MRFRFDSGEAEEEDEQQLQTIRSPSRTPKEEVQWFPLQAHPLFTSAALVGESPARQRRKTTRNLMAWDGASRLYFWDSNQRCLHRISVRLGEPDAHSVIAASPSKILRADRDLTFTVNKVSINKNGSTLLLAGSDGLCVMYLCGRSSSRENSITCRTLSIGREIFFNCNSSINILQAAWHPYSDTHVGVLSSDSVFRIFDLTSASGKPEQEYYLQPMEPGRARNASSLCPVDFSFGRDHLWDRFSVFILFSNGTVYILCPVAPFGSVYMWDSVMEIYSDAQAFGLKAANANAVKNSMLAISWLEATFPGLKQQEKQPSGSSSVKTHAYSLIDASLLLQGPLGKVSRSGEDQIAHAAGCEGHATSFLYSSIGKDSILVTAWSGGQLQVDAMADEIQPLWNTGISPRLRVDAHNQILGFAMICEALPGQLPLITLDQSSYHTDWLGQPPPLLRLAIVDLALPRSKEIDPLISMYIDPLLPERIYAVHDGGVDSIILHFLPFTSQMNGKDLTMKTPSVYPVFYTDQGDSSSSHSMLGFVTLADSFGYSWVVGVTSTQECIVLEMKTWNVLIPVLVDTKKNSSSLEEPVEKDTPDIISKELLSGPKPVVIPQASPNMKSSVDSIEGQSILHQYSKLFHENYVEYAHKVYIELKHHGPHVKRIVDNLNTRLSEGQKKISDVEQKSLKIDERVQRAVELHSLLEERLQRLRRLPGVHKKPLSRAEREFKIELDAFQDVELDALRSSIDAVNARLKRYVHQSSNSSASVPPRHILEKKYVSGARLTQVRATLEKLTAVNSDNSKKVKQLESALRSLELTK